MKNKSTPIKLGAIKSPELILIFRNLFVGFVRGFLSFMLRSFLKISLISMPCNPSLSFTFSCVFYMFRVRSFGRIRLRQNTMYCTRSYSLNGLYECQKHYITYHAKSTLRFYEIPIIKMKKLQQFRNKIGAVSLFHIY